MLLSAKLAILTRNATYVQWADKVYEWLKAIRLIRADYTVLDGAYAPSCRVRDGQLHSYNYGALLGALGYMYAYTKDQKYLDEAKKLLQASIPIFVSNDIIYEQLCEKEIKCKRDQKSFKGVYVKGLRILYSVTQDRDMKSDIQRIIDASFLRMIRACDDDGHCPFYWIPEADNVEWTKDVFNQHPSAELALAFATIHLNSTDKAITNVTGSVPSPNQPSPPAQNDAMKCITNSLACLFIIVIFIVL
jgi:uncharacterized protein YyaL (SSP411 family)